MLLYTGAINFEDGPGLLFGQSVFRYHIFDCKGKGKCKRRICIAPCREHTFKALRYMYGTRSQGISQFYLHTSPAFIH